MSRNIIHVILISITFGGAVAGAAEYYVSDDEGSDLWDGKAPVFSGGKSGPKQTIQAAIDTALSGDEVIVADGYYSGYGNRDLYFRDKILTIRSKNGPGQCIINCQGAEEFYRRAFMLTTDSTVEGFIFINGYAWGGAIFCDGSRPTIRRCIFWGNRSDSKGGGIAGYQAAPTIENCIFFGNSAVNGGGLFGTDSEFVVTNCIFLENYSGQDFSGGNGGGLYFENNSQALLNRCHLSRNRAAKWGGGIYCQDSTIDVRNTLINGNRADSYGGGMYGVQSTILLHNCTLNFNIADWYGGGVRFHNHSTATIVNSIFWNNELNNPEGGKEVALALNSSVSISYTNIKGGVEVFYQEPDCTVHWGEGNISIDPAFVRNGFWDNRGTALNGDDDLWNEGDYHLLSAAGRWDPSGNSWVMDDRSSPCIDGGDPNDAPSHEIWPHGSRINMGAYGGTAEASLSPAQAGRREDLNLDGRVNLTDMTILSARYLDQGPLLREDINRDGLVGLSDLMLLAESWLK